MLWTSEGNPNTVSGATLNALSFSGIPGWQAARRLQPTATKKLTITMDRVRG